MGISPIGCIHRQDSPDSLGTSQRNPSISKELSSELNPCAQAKRISLSKVYGTTKCGFTTCTSTAIHQGSCLHRTQSRLLLRPVGEYLTGFLGFQYSTSCHSSVNFYRLANVLALLPRHVLIINPAVSVTRDFPIGFYHRCSHLRIEFQSPCHRKYRTGHMTL